MRGNNAPSLLAQIGQQRLLRCRTLLPLLLIVVYACREPLWRFQTPTKEQQQDVQLLPRQQEHGLDLVLSQPLSNKIPMHTCRDGEQTLQMPEKIPGFMIIGTPKGGTTALFMLLNMKADAMSSKAVETHFFDIRMHLTPRGNKTALELTDADVCLLRSRYVNNYFSVPTYLNATQSGKPMVVYEKTPAYVRKPGVAAKVHRILGPDLKLLVILRNPIDRAFSGFRMQHERVGREFCLDTPKDNVTFDELVASEIDQLRQLGLSPAPSIESFLADQQDRIDDHFSFVPPKMTEELRFRMEEAIGQSTSHRLPRLCGLYWNSLLVGMYAMQLKEWIQYYPLGTHLKVIRSEELKANRKEVFGSILEFVGLSTDEIDEDALNQDLSPQTFEWFNSTKKEIPPARESTLHYLRLFYKPYNDELADLLGEEWRGVWDS